MASPHDAPLSFTSSVTVSEEPFAEQLDRITAVRPAALAQRNAHLFKEVLHLICWIRSTEYLLPLDRFQIHASVVAHNGPVRCPSVFEAQIDPTDYFTELHTIKILFYVTVTNRWVVVRESACSHSDPWQSMNCFVQELRKEFSERAGSGAELAQVPLTGRYRGPRRPRRTALAGGQKADTSNSRSINQALALVSNHEVHESKSKSVTSESRPDSTHRKDAQASGQKDDESNSQSANSEYRPDFTPRKDSVQPTSSFGNEETKKDLAQIWRQG